MSYYILKFDTFCLNLSLSEDAVHGFTIGRLITKSHDVHNCSLTFQYNYENVVLTQKKKKIFINMKIRKNSNNSRASLFI